MNAPSMWKVPYWGWILSAQIQYLGGSSGWWVGLCVVMAAVNGTVGAVLELYERKKQ